MYGLPKTLDGKLFDDPHFESYRIRLGTDEIIV
jgi:hypothetical protein